MNKKQLKALADFAPVVRDKKRPALNGIFVNFEDGVAVATDGKALVELTLDELRVSGAGKHIIPIASVKDALKVVKGKFSIKPGNIGCIAYTPMDLPYVGYKNAIPENKAPGVLPWCDPYLLVKFEKFREAFKAEWSVALPETLLGAVKFNLFYLNSDSELGYDPEDQKATIVIMPKRGVLSNHKEYCTAGKRKA